MTAFPPAFPFMQPAAKQGVAQNPSHGTVYASIPQAHISERIMIMSTTTAKTYYDILGVSRTATLDEIRKAYLKLAHKYHPDKTGGDKKAETRLKEMNEAYDTLKKEDRRKLYDAQLDNPFAGAEGFSGARPGPEPSGPGFDPASFFSQFDLGSMFGAGFEQRFGGAGAKVGQGAAAGASFETHVRVTLREAAEGVTRKVSLAAPGGKPREVTINVPPGAETGLRLRHTGQGAPANVKGGRAGDLYVIVEVEPDPVFERHGQDLLSEARISFAEAALGAKVTVPTLKGKAHLTVPPGTQSGQQFRLRGMGLPVLGGGPKGDQTVRVQIEVPTQLTPEQRELIEKLARTDPKRHGR